MMVDTTSIALGPILAEVSKDDMAKVLSWLERIAVVVESGVESVGPPSNYALVWEWGNARQTKKGPKTTKGKNPDGKSVWLTIQAPRGWIGIHEPAMWKVIEEEIDKVDFSSANESSLRQGLEQAYIRIAQRALELLQSTVPIDKGDLYDSLKVVRPGDDVLKEVSDISSEMISSFGSLNL